MFDVLIADIYEAALVAPYVRYVRTSDGFIKNFSTGAYAVDTAWANSMFPLTALTASKLWGFENVERESAVPVTIQFLAGEAEDNTDTVLFLSSNNKPSNIAY